jgi:hypothetical protein
MQPRVRRTTERPEFAPRSGKEPLGVLVLHLHVSAWAAESPPDSDRCGLHYVTCGGSVLKQLIRSRIGSVMNSLEQEKLWLLEKFSVPVAVAVRS